MTRWWLAPEAADDLERLADFLHDAAPDLAADTVDLIFDALATLSRHPHIGRPLAHGLQEPVISRGRAGYLALYSYDEQHDAVLVRCSCWPFGIGARTTIIDESSERRGQGRGATGALV